MRNLANVIILGCGRSGTSIFGELFEHFRDYQYYSEPDYAAIKSFTFDCPIAIKVPKTNLKYLPTLGLSFPLNDLINTLPKPIKFYWQVRHPLDTICSLKVGIAKNWGHHPRPSDWRNWLDRPLVEQCAHHWNYINTIGYEAVEELIEIKHFEELIGDSFSFARSIAKEVGLEVEENKTALLEWSNRVQNTNNAKFIEARTSAPYSTKDHSVKIDRWKENLTAEEVEKLVPMVKETALRFGYILQ